MEDELTITLEDKKEEDKDEKPPAKKLKTEPKTPAAKTAKQPAKAAAKAVAKTPAKVVKQEVKTPAKTPAKAPVKEKDDKKVEAVKKEPAPKKEELETWKMQEEVEELKEKKPFPETFSKCKTFLFFSL